uniref:ATP-dependent RNA helicase n=1 Tax=Trichobilharzia regenti TaxID=157069 RepID=A0AA85J2W2_TRIRE|nr:unnamed protein product [Trichobilharzia regenti]
MEDPASHIDKKPEPECSEENLYVIEELDADTGEVRAMHSLASVSTTCPETLESTEPPVSLSVQMKANRVYGLVLVPTRELAIQVSQHLRMLTRYINCIRIETIMGGISIDKQLRLLQRCPDILVATPGRLWHFIQQDEPHILTLPNVSVVVIDEADRMIEANHFDDLRAIFDWLHSGGSMSSDACGSVNDEGNNEEEEAVEFENSNKKTKNLKRKSVDDSANNAPIDRQTLVFSATLTFVHGGALKPGSGSKKHKMLSGNKSNMTKKIKLALLREMFGLRKSVQVIDLSSSSSPNSQLNQKASTGGQHSQQQPACPDGLCESRLLCPNQESKDNRLFWFITFGRQLASACLPVKLSNQRCLIFLNSKSGVRRLAGVLRQLVESDAFSVGGYSSSVKHISVLHADMIQKQRLRALERFQADPNGILLASDVAARGLDLASKDTTDETSGVSWVIHFDVPHTAELYIHRSGRTARANRQGTSLLFISPNEIIRWHKIAVSLKRNNPELEDFAVQPSNIHLTICEQIVHLAKQIDIQVHRNSRKTANENWFAKAAKDANILLDDNNSGDSDSEGGRGYSEKKKSKKKKNSDDTKPLKLQLRQLIHASRDKLLKNTNGQLQQPVYGKLQTLSKVKLLKEVCV